MLKALIRFDDFELHLIALSEELLFSQILVDAKSHYHFLKAPKNRCLLCHRVFPSRSELWLQAMPFPFRVQKVPDRRADSIMVVADRASVQPGGEDV